MSRQSSGAASQPPDFPSSYDPEIPESKWYRVWEEAGYFRPEVNPDGEPYAIVIPPPNVTGSLHMGHAFEHSLIDATIRRKRMQGYAALWLPGTDHAGIATQNVVERQLADEGLSRHDLGREAFVERVWAWKEKSGGEILNQMRRMGDSCDWSRERFTLDEALSKAVRRVFVTLHEEGLIYRGERIINWCPRCHTAISDIEVDYEDVEGEMVEILYPWDDGQEGGITVATTRAETMLGDTAVAVNPEDSRYRDLVGRRVALPLTDRVIEVVADEAIDSDFGTGAVKVTPGHDPTDFEIGERHGLEVINIFDVDATVTDAGGSEFAGLDRFEARKAVKEALSALGLLVSVETYTHSVGHCQRCATPVEPIVSKQWFVKVRPLSDPALAAVLDGETDFYPERWVKVYRDWMENIRDWCISRQLWWGHRIPVWYCEGCDAEMVEVEDPKVCSSCGGTAFRQDPDVLDTWFSSALWPFSTLGWPDETEDLKRFYPNAMLHTGFDIIFFWVARMMQMGIHFMGEVPFGDVAYHGLVRDSSGRKMSKSAGNVIDPLELADRYGADSLRWALTRAASPGQDVPLAEEWVEGARNFINKLWNASRFVSMNLDGMSIEEAAAGEPLDDAPGRWIRSQLAATIASVDAGFDRYNYADALRELHRFAWGDFCDWYIEMAKASLADPERRRGAQANLARVLRGLLLLLHPSIPFVTEELWHRLGGEGHLVIARWPERSDEDSDTAAVAEIAAFREVVSAIRSFRSAHGLSPRLPLDISINLVDSEVDLVGTGLLDEMCSLANLGSVGVSGGGVDDVIVTGSFARLVTSSGEVVVAVEGVLDLEAERKRIEKKLAAISDDVARVQKKLANEAFVSKAPPEVVAKEESKRAEFIEVRDALERHLAELGG